MKDVNDQKTLVKHLLRYVASHNPDHAAAVIAEEDALFRSLSRLAGRLAQSTQDAAAPLGCCMVPIPGSNEKECHADMTESACLNSFPNATWVLGLCNSPPCRE